MFNPSVGMIFKCSNGKFVKIQGSGLVEQPDTKYGNYIHEYS
jgi:RNase P/RNase MRP subunit p29